MEEDTNKKGRSSPKHIYDYNTGLAIMVNLYIIKYIYYHIEKADMFMEKKGLSRKGKAYPVYQNWIPVSRQRFDRINKGMRFEFSTGEAAEITEMFGIDMDYFKWSSPKMFDIEGISIDDWKRFYEKKYMVAYGILDEEENKENNETKENKENEEDKSGADKNTEENQKQEKPKEIAKIETALKKMVISGWKNNAFKNNPLFNVCYFFHNGYRCDKTPRVEVVQEALEKMSFDEWDSIDIESRKKIQQLLKSHERYIHALNILEEMRKK